MNSDSVDSNNLIASTSTGDEPIATGSSSSVDILSTHVAPSSFIPGYLDTPAWKRLISHALLPHEVISLIGAIFTSRDEVKVICGLHGDDAQTFINVLREVCFVCFLSRGIFQLPLFSSAPPLLNFDRVLPRLWISLISCHAFGGSV